MRRPFLACCAAALLLFPALRARAQDPVRIDLLNLLGESVPSHDELADAKLILIEKRQLLLVDLAGRRARFDALDKSLAQADAEASSFIASDDGIVAFTRSLESEKKQLAAVQRSGGSPIEVAVHLAEVARQQSIIAERRDEIRTRYHDGVLLELTRQRTIAEFDVTEIQAALTALDAQLARLTQSQSAAK